MGKLQVDVQSLKKGMYVSELDRPWSDTPFLFQGFRITNDDELKMLLENCEYAYVDEEKSTIDVDPNLAVLNRKSASSKKEKKLRFLNPFNFAKKNKTRVKRAFEDEFINAKELYQESSSTIKTVFEDIRLGKSIKIKGVRKTVKSLTESIVGNPDALKLLCAYSEKSTKAVDHALHVCVLTLAFGSYLGMRDKDLYELGMGALLHDVGEINLDDDILKKSEAYTSAELERIKLHTEYGVEILENTPGISDVVIEIARNHHERKDCSGYPNKLCGTAISYNTVLVSIVDVYDKVTMGYENKPVIPPTEALKNIYNWRDDLFDSDLVELFIQCLGIYPVGSVVELNTGEVGIVITFQDSNRLLPRIMLIKDKTGSFYSTPKILDLAIFNREFPQQAYEIKRVLDAATNDIDVRNFVLRDLQVTALSA